MTFKHPLGLERKKNYIVEARWPSGLEHQFSKFLSDQDIMGSNPAISDLFFFFFIEGPLRLAKSPLTYFFANSDLFKCVDGVRHSCPMHQWYPYSSRHPCYKRMQTSTQSTDILRQSKWTKLQSGNIVLTCSFKYNFKIPVLGYF